jgi:hypothetical protein
MAWPKGTPRPAETRDKSRETQLHNWAARKQWDEVSEAILQARSEGDTERASLLLNAYLAAHNPRMRARLYNLAPEDDG